MIIRNSQTLFTHWYPHILSCDTAVLILWYGLGIVQWPVSRKRLWRIVWLAMTRTMYHCTAAMGHIIWWETKGSIWLWRGWPVSGRGQLSGWILAELGRDSARQNDECCKRNIWLTMWHKFHVETLLKHFPIQHQKFYDLTRIVKASWM